MSQFIVSSYQLQKWALAIKLAQDRSKNEHDQAHINRSMREIDQVLHTQDEALSFSAGYDTDEADKRTAT